MDKQNKLTNLSVSGLTKLESRIINELQNILQELKQNHFEGYMIEQILIQIIINYDYYFTDKGTFQLDKEIVVKILTEDSDYFNIFEEFYNKAVLIRDKNENKTEKIMLHFRQAYYNEGVILRSLTNVFCISDYLTPSNKEKITLKLLGSKYIQIIIVAQSLNNLFEELKPFIDISNKLEGIAELKILITVSDFDFSVNEKELKEYHTNNIMFYYPDFEKFKHKQILSTRVSSYYILVVNNITGMIEIYLENEPGKDFIGKIKEIYNKNNENQSKAQQDKERGIEFNEGIEDKLNKTTDIQTKSIDKSKEDSCYFKLFKKFKSTIQNLGLDGKYFGEKEVSFNFHKKISLSSKKAVVTIQKIKLLYSNTIKFNQLINKLKIAFPNQNLEDFIEIKHLNNKKNLQDIASTLVNYSKQNNFSLEKILIMDYETSLLKLSQNSKTSYISFFNGTFSIDENLIDNTSKCISYLTQYIKDNYDITKLDLEREHHWSTTDNCPICEEEINTKPFIRRV